MWVLSPGPQALEEAVIQPAAPVVVEPILPAEGAVVPPPDPVPEGGGTTEGTVQGTEGGVKAQPPDPPQGVPPPPVKVRLQLLRLDGDIEGGATIEGVGQVYKNKRFDFPVGKPLKLSVKRWSWSQKRCGTVSSGHTRLVVDKNGGTCTLQ